MVSTSDTFAAPQTVLNAASFEGDLFNGPPRVRYENSPSLQLPAPLGRGPSPGSPVSNVSQSRLSEDATPFIQGHDGPHQRLLQTSPSVDYSHEYSPDSYEQHSSVPGHSQASIESHMNRMGGVLRQGALSTQYPVETQNPYRHPQPQAAMSYEESYPYSTEPEELPQSYSAPNRNNRGVSLADNGPVPGPEGVRRVARPQARRASAQSPSTNGNRYSRNSISGGPSSNSGLPLLPPGAAAPSPYPYR